MRIKLNENNYSVSERQYRLYRFLSENANKDYVLSSKRIYDYLDDLGIQITPATLYNDLRAIESMAKIKIEYDQSKKGYYIKNPKFQPHELRMIVDSVQASQFITQKEAEKITAKVVSLTDIHTASKLKRQAYVANRIRSMNAFCCLRDDERRPRIFERCVKMFDEVQFFSHKNNTHPFTKNNEKGCVLKTAVGKAKALENTRFSRALELLGRFELPTSSLPIIQDLFLFNFNCRIIATGKH